MPEVQTPAPTTAPAPPVRTRSATVTIGCKLPNGLILQLCDMTTVRTPAPGGFVEEQIARRREESHTLNGVAFDFDKMRRGITPPLIVDGYALTSDIPRDFWEEWLKQNEGMALIRNKQVFAMADEASARSFANEHREVRSGLEPIDPNHPELFRDDLRRSGIRKGTTREE